MDKNTETLLREISSDIAKAVENNKSYMTELQSYIGNLKQTSKVAKDAKQYFDYMLSFNNSFRDLAKYLDSLKAATKKVEWLELLNIAVTLFKCYKKLPTVNRNMRMDEVFNEFQMENGRYDLPNAERAVDIDDPDWETVIDKKAMFSRKYVLQRNLKKPKYARIIQVKYNDNVQIAHGHIEAMEEKLRRYHQPKFFRPGDIIYIDREDIHIHTDALRKYIKKKTEENAGVEPLTIPIPAYAHVGIYIGMGEVIHFAGKTDLTGKKTVHSCNLKEFVNSHNKTKTESDIYVMHFPGDGKTPYKLYPNTSDLDIHPAHIEIFKQDCFKNMKCYSPEETISRAKKIMASKEYGHYHIIENNCEHFAFFCKTGRKLSTQTANANDIGDIIINVAQIFVSKVAFPLEITKQIKNRCFEHSAEK